MKLTKKALHELNETLNQLNTGISFILDQNTAIMRKTTLTSADRFTSSLYPDVAFMSVNKEIGSNLALLYSAKSRLERFISKGGN